MLYHLRRSIFQDRVVPTVLQSVNGPCPILAICNILLLRGEISIHEQQRTVTFEEIVLLLKQYLERRLSMHVDEAVDEAKLANDLQNLEDTLHLLPKLEKGLDLNVYFTDPSKYEYTPEIAAFDLFSIRLFHGWICDPQDTETASALSDMSYNQAVVVLAGGDMYDQHEEDAGEKGEEHNSDVEAEPGVMEEVKAEGGHVGEGGEGGGEGGDEPVQESEERGKSEEIEQDSVVALDVHKKELIQEWFSTTSTQLTHYGLLRLHEVIRAGELCILFRNNHFNVLIKHRTHLFTLVTDEGVVSTYPRVMWQRIGDIDGDDVFVTSEFRGLSAPSSASSSSASNSQNGQSRPVPLSSHQPQQRPYMGHPQYHSYPSAPPHQVQYHSSAQPQYAQHSYPQQQPHFSGHVASLPSQQHYPPYSHNNGYSHSQQYSQPHHGYPGNHIDKRKSKKKKKKKDTSSCIIT